MYVRTHGRTGGRTDVPTDGRAGLYVSCRVGNCVGGDSWVSHAGVSQGTQGETPGGTSGGRLIPLCTRAPRGTHLFKMLPSGACFYDVEL